MIKKIIKNYLILFCVLVGTSFTAFSHNAVKITQENTEDIVILLKDHPKVSIENSLVKVLTDSNEISYQATPSVRFNFLDYDPTYVNKISKDAVAFKIDQNIIEAYNLVPYLKITISDLSGRIIKSTSADTNGHINIDIFELPKGVYVFSSSDHNFKFLKK